MENTQQQIAAAQNEILRLRDELKKGTDELQATLTSVSVLYQISSELSGIEDKTKANSTFVSSVCKMFSVDVGVLIEVDKAGESYKTLECIGLSRAEAAELSGPIIGSVFEKIRQTSKPLRLKDPGDDVLPGVVQHLSVKSALFVPIIPKRQTELILLCCRMYAGEFSFEEERIINILGIKLAETLDSIIAQESVEESLSLINATVESMSEGIMVVDMDWRITLYNNQFTTMWKIPQEVMDKRDAMEVARFVSTELSDPAAFSKKVETLHDNPDSSVVEVFEFKDGRVIERNSAPQRVKDKTVGRVWSFHDVTAIKRAESQLEIRMKEVEEMNGFMVDRELKMVELKNEIKQLRAGV